MASEAYKKWYAANKERLIKKASERNKRLKLERREYCKKYYHSTKTPEKQSVRAIRRKQRYWNDPEKARKLARKYREKLRAEFIQAYGGKCACCGEAEPAFLTLEHKNRDGAAHRKQFSTSTQILAHLRSLGWPKEDYEILCFNCNRASWEQGICPHRKGAQDNA